MEPDSSREGRELTPPVADFVVGGAGLGLLSWFVLTTISFLDAKEQLTGAIYLGLLLIGGGIAALIGGVCGLIGYVVFYGTSRRHFGIRIVWRRVIASLISVSITVGIAVGAAITIAPLFPIWFFAPVWLVGGASIYMRSGKWLRDGPELEHQ